MGLAREMDDLIGRASELKEQVGGLLALYEEILSALESDKEAIKASDMFTLEALAARKVALSSSIEERFSLVRDIVTALRRASERIPGAAPLPDQVALSGVVAWLEELCKSNLFSGLPQQVLGHVLGGLRTMADRLIEVHRQSKPALEANRYLLQQLLVIQQENFRFWQEVAQATMSNYNAHGEQRSSGGRSVLRVKA